MATLVVVEQGKKTSFELQSGLNSIGRHPDCSIEIVQGSGRRCCGFWLFKLRDGIAELDYVVVIQFRAGRDLLFVDKCSSPAASVFDEELAMRSRGVVRASLTGTRNDGSPPL